MCECVCVCVCVHGNVCDYGTNFKVIYSNNGTELLEPDAHVICILL